MKLSVKAEYTCLAVISLPQQGSDSPPVRVREIAESHAIPERYLVQILIQLKASGLVHSARGAAGGYKLSRPPDRITLGEVLTAIEGPGEPPRESNGTAEQQLTSVLDDIRSNEREILARTTIAHLAGRADPHNWVI